MASEHFLRDPPSSQEERESAAKFRRRVTFVIVCSCAFCLVVSVVQSAIVEKTGIFRDIWGAVGWLLGGVAGYRLRGREGEASSTEVGQQE